MGSSNSSFLVQKNTITTIFDISSKNAALIKLSKKKNVSPLKNFSAKLSTSLRIKFKKIIIEQPKINVLKTIFFGSGN